MKHDRISQSPGVMFGKPCIKGTRIPVAMLLELLGGGASESWILEGYPTLCAEDLRAAQAFAADYLMRHHRLIGEMLGDYDFFADAAPMDGIAAE
jgi:uncharacterized protein (DUF433 family)